MDPVNTPNTNPTKVEAPSKDHTDEPKNRKLARIEAAAVLTIVELPSVQEVPRLLSFLSFHNLGTLARTSTSMKKEACTEFQQRRQDFMTQVEPFGLSNPTFYPQLIKLFDNDSSLMRLSLNNNQIGDLGAQALAGALPQNSSLTVLDLGSNQIGDLGVQALAGALPQNSSLTGLDLDVNQIGDLGAQALAGALPQNSSLTRLYLINNQIGNLGAQALAPAVASGRVFI